VEAEFAGDEKHGRKKLAERSPKKFAGNEMQNFGDRSAGLRVAAREKGRTYGISTSRATPAYI
jgi:glycine cleavage system aminomethyltransferase T